MGADRDLRIQVILDAMDKASGPMRKIKGEATQMGRSIRETSESLRALKKSQSDLQGFRDLKRGLAGTKKDLGEAEEKAKRLGKAIAQVEKPTAKMTREFKAASREAGDLRRKLEAQHRDLGTLRERLLGAGVNTRNLAQEERKLRTEVEATNTKLKQQRDRLKELSAAAPRRLSEMRAGLQADRDIETERGRRHERLAGKAGLFNYAVAAGAAVTGVSAAKEAAAVESIMTDIALKANIGRDQAERIGRIVEGLAPQVNQMPLDMASTLDSLAGKGLDPTRAGLAMLQPIGKAATAYKADMLELGDATFAVVDNLKVPAERTARILDIMAQAGKRGSFEVRDMAQYFPALTASMQALGYTGEKAAGDLAAALQITRTATGDASSAANNLQNLLDKINTENTIKNFKEFGIDLPAAMKKAYRDGKSPIEAIIDLINKATKGDTSKIAFLFGDAEVQKAVRPLAQKMKFYTDIRADALRANGVVDNDFARRQLDTAAKWQEATSRWAAVKAAWGKKITPAANPVLDFVNETLRRAQLKASAEGRAQLQREGSGWGRFFEGGKRVRRDQIGARPRIRRDGDKAIQHEEEAAARRTAARVALLHAQIRAQNKLLEQEMRRVGVNAMLGLTAGMDSQASAVKAKALAIASSTFAIMNSFFKIRSPSRLMMETGSHITAGLALGIDRGGRQPVDRMRGIAAGITAALAVGSAKSPPAGTGGAGVVAATGGRGAGAPAVQISATFHITGVAAQDGPQIEAAVERALERSRLRAEAAARSSYDDGD